MTGSPVTFVIRLVVMKKQTLSVFVDESGVLSKDDPTSRFYIVTLVTHDQSFSIAELAKRLDCELDSVGIANLYFQASMGYDPIDRKLLITSRRFCDG